MTGPLKQTVVYRRVAKMNGHEFVEYFLALSIRKISMLKVIYHQYGVPSGTFLLITCHKVVKCLQGAHQICEYNMSDSVKNFC